MMIFRLGPGYDATEATVLHDLDADTHSNYSRPTPHLTCYVQPLRLAPGARLPNDERS